MTHSDNLLTESPTKTTCPYCGVGCGVSATIENDQIIAVSGDRQHPANLGKLCVKGAALDKTMGSQGRLLEPSVDGQAVSWETAIETVADKLNTIREKHGPGAIAFYLSGQLLTEDYYVANKLAKGFIGTGHVDTNSRLCMSSAVAGYKRAFGSDAVPCNYEDLEQCDLLVMTGSNAAWTHPVLYRRIAAAKEKNPAMRVVVIDPRQTATCDLADLHLAIAPGSDAFVFSGLLKYLKQTDSLDRDYIEQYTQGFDAAIAQTMSVGQVELEKKIGVNPEDLATFYQWYAETEKTITFYSMGVNQSATGTDKCNAIINCHLATGRIGKVGAGPFSITGQPNAMGGREVGGLANMLAAHMDYSTENLATVSEFWNSDNMSQQPGFKAVEMFDAIADGRIKAIWIMGTNPVVSMPDANLVKAALEQCDTVIVSDCIAQTDTTATANILLPASGWGEKCGTVTNSERRISRQRSLVTPIAEAKSDWWIISRVAQAMGFASAFNYQSARDIFVEHARLSGFKNNGTRLFNISALSEISAEEYDQLEPVQWPVTAAKPNGTERLFEDGQFITPSGKAQFVAVAATLPLPRKAEEQFPLILNSGRIRDQWHTMTRTGRASELLTHIEQPTVAIHPQTAKDFGLENGDLAEITTQQGSINVVAQIDPGMQLKQLFVPIHWNDQFASSARVDSLVAPIIDGVSGQPEFKYSRAAIKKIETPCWATVVSRNRISCSEFINWVVSPLPGNLGFIYQVALGSDFDWQAYMVAANSDLSTDPRAYAQFSDRANLDQRLICYTDKRMELAIFSHRDKQALPPKTWMQTLLNNSAIDTYWSLLSGPNNSQQDSSRLICSCFKVSEQRIVDAIEAGANSAEALGEQLNCGTNCGSCIPELNSLIAQLNTSQPDNSELFEEISLSPTTSTIG
ncbi:MAG: molybdopterin-dependent oxidoreductase [Porticoccaceae bacterium]